MLRRSVMTALFLISLGMLGLAFLMTEEASANPRIIQIEEVPLAKAPCDGRPLAGLLFVSDGSGSASSSAIAPPSQPVVPADQLHDPVADPIKAFDDVRAAQKIGWPLALLATLVMAARGLSSAGKRWPSVRWLSWLNTGARAFVIAGLTTLSCAAFNTLALGGTWFAVAMAACAAFLTLVTPSPKTAA